MVTIKTPAEIELMAAGGAKLGRILKTLASEVRSGIATNLLEKHAQELIRAAGSEPAFLNYRSGGSDQPFPAALCVSVNATVVHGLPSDYTIQPGDLVKLDLGLIEQGFYLDSAVTIGVAPSNEVQKKLIAVTHQALVRGIKAAKVGATTGDIGAAIEACIKQGGFAVVQSLTGHGIGRDLHEDPVVLNTGRPSHGEKLESGMVLAIEPMVAAGSGKVKQLRDGSFVTRDGSLAAHFEHTVAITAKGPRILTRI